MTDFTKELLFGMRPVRRTNPRPGESSWYYLDPRGADTFDSMKHIDVESETSPNPYAGEIQNYLYKNDPYNYKQLYGNTPPPVQNNQLTMNTTSASGQQIPSINNNDPNCYIEFDGHNVDLYKYGQFDGNRLQNGQLQDNLRGQSGGDDYQSGIHQDVPNKGPIPEGTYYANQDQRQNITAFDATAGIIGHGKWPGSLPAWGTKRVWLRPDANTNTYNRSGFTIHGGLTKGSAGCIDIPWQTGRLSDYLDDCQDSVPVYVKYPKDW